MTPVREGQLIAALLVGKKKQLKIQCRSIITPSLRTLHNQNTIHCIQEPYFFVRSHLFQGLSVTKVLVCLVEIITSLLKQIFFERFN